MIVLSYVAAGLFGAAVGSFLNVCIYRIPREGMTVARPASSFCPSCQTPIRPRDNIPILSWLWLRARCRSCGVKISARYPFVEALTAGFFLLVVWRLGGPPLDLAWLAAALFWSALMAVLIVITYIDIDHRIIPDELSVTGAAVVPFAAWWIPPVVRDQQLAIPINPALPLPLKEGLDSLARVDAGDLFPWLLGGAGIAGAAVSLVGFRRWSPAWDGSRRTWWECRLAAVVGGLVSVVVSAVLFRPGWLDAGANERLVASLLGMTVGAGSIYGIGVVGKLVFRKDAMGFGDVKLMALLGAVVGAREVLLAVFVACFLGSVVGIVVKAVTRSSYIPFGPFLAAGAAVLIFATPAVDAAIRWYMSLLRGG